MKRIFLLACFVASILIAPVHPVRAADSGFTPDQRKQIIEIIRDALKTDPTILRDAFTALQASDAAREEADTKARIAAQHSALVANARDPVAGNPSGDVTVVEFYDPRCPYCRRMLPAIESLLQKDHGVRLVYKDIPVLGAASLTETRAILAAQKQGGYLKMQAALMSNAADPSPEMIHDTAKSVGLDPVRLAADMNGHAVSDKIQENVTLAHALKVDGTPIFVVGDSMIPGAVDQSALEEAIAAARKKS